VEGKRVKARALRVMQRLMNDVGDSQRRAQRWTGTRGCAGSEINVDMLGCIICSLPAVTAAAALSQVFRGVIYPGVSCSFSRPKLAGPLNSSPSVHLIRRFLPSSSSSRLSSIRRPHSPLYLGLSRILTASPSLPPLDASLHGISHSNATHGTF